MKMGEVADQWRVDGDVADGMNTERDTVLQWSEQMTHAINNTKERGTTVKFTTLQRLKCIDHFIDRSAMAWYARKQKERRAAMSKEEQEAYK